MHVGGATLNSIPDDIQELWGELVALTTERIRAEGGFEYYPCVRCSKRFHRSEMTFSKGVPILCKSCSHEVRDIQKLTNPEGLRKNSRKANRKRKARKSALPNTLSVEDRGRCLDYWGHKCAVCGRTEGLWNTVVLDHWIPLSDPDCPGTIAENMIPLCHGDNGCNNRKHGTRPDVWLIRLLGEKKAKRKLAEIAAYFEWVKG